jgi:hypothetical protein
MATSTMTDASRSDEPIVFVNYRRTDAGWPAEVIERELKNAFGQDRVFLDTREINAGDDFTEQLEDGLRRAGALLVLVGAGWLQAHDRFGRRRLDSPNDWVRREIRTALSNERCRVIPVLVDDATLPDEPEALPGDIAALLNRQPAQVRQAHIDDDIAVLSTVLEQQGFRRLRQPGTGPLGDQEFSDRKVNDVVARLRDLHHRRRSEFLDGRELLSELDLLFNRKTFRFETLRECSEQRWRDRLDSAYQTLRVLQAYMRNVRAAAPDKYRVYVDLVDEVEGYVMQMGQLLFKPPVDANELGPHVGKETFKDHVPPAIRFRPARDKKPVIADQINDAIESHRVRAIQLMDELQRA